MKGADKLFWVAIHKLQKKTKKQTHDISTYIADVSKAFVFVWHVFRPWIAHIWPKSRTLTGWFSLLVGLKSHPNLAGWWFARFFIFDNIWDNPSHWLPYFSRCLLHHQPDRIQNIESTGVSTLYLAPKKTRSATLWWTYEKQWKMAIEIVDFPLPICVLGLRTSRWKIWVPCLKFGRDELGGHSFCKNVKSSKIHYKTIYE